MAFSFRMVIVSSHSTIEAQEEDHTRKDKQDFILSPSNGEMNKKAQSSATAIPRRMTPEVKDTTPCSQPSESEELRTHGSPTERQSRLYLRVLLQVIFITGHL